MLSSARPVLLRAPTGSGKTIMIGRTLNDTRDQLPTVWFWFVPYTHLVGATRNALSDHCPKLHPYALATQRQYDHRPGDVLVAQVQTVASANQAREVYQPRDEGVPSVNELVARARAAGHLIGIVIDEAHIGVSSETEFGKFCRRLNPDRLLLATATPKDSKLTSFLAASGHDEIDVFPVGRDEVVEAHLNKRYVAAFVYRANEAWQSLADLQKTVLKRAWQRHLGLSDRLAELGCPTVPLMLVQVANGDHAIREAYEYLTMDCGVPAEKIARYESGDRNPQALTAMANDFSKQVLIFKEAAGTGFDAPRAFILASTKNVSDGDFATQFIGRIMRVDRHVRALARSTEGPFDPDLDTAYVYLANANVQAGYAEAVARVRSIKTSFEGALERLVERILPDGSAIITNRPTNQPSLGLKHHEPETADDVLVPPEREGDILGNDEREIVKFPGQSPSGKQIGQAAFPFNIANPPKREGVSGGVTPRPTNFLKQHFRDENAIYDACRAHGIQVYPRRTFLDGFPTALHTERRPTLTDRAEIVAAVTRRLALHNDFVARAARNALGGILGREIKTELTQNAAPTEQEISIELDRAALGSEAISVLSRLPQFESGDVRRLLTSITARVTEQVNHYLETLPPGMGPGGKRLEQFRRDVTHLLVRARQAEIAELVNDEIAARVIVEESGPLPSAMMFPSDISLTQSAKNIYGVLPPTPKQLEDGMTLLSIDERRAFHDQTVQLSDRKKIVLGSFDGNWVMNKDEVEFARALDQANFVVWWTRNPDRKEYSAGIVRSDVINNWYPDFVVCIRLWDGDTPSVRLLETKDSTKDAANKARRPSKAYGQVLFLTRNNSRLYLINKDGSLGEEVDPDLQVLKDELRLTAT
jgi:type III restriction enzyme